jgi:phosphomannomutase
MKLNPDIFKAYDVRGVYPGEVNEDAARAIGAAFVAYLQAKRIAVSRDMRLSSPSLAEAFIDGAVFGLRRGRLRDDGDRHALFRGRPRRARGGVRLRRRTARTVQQMKMVRKDAWPLSGDRQGAEILRRSPTTVFRRPRLAWTRDARTCSTPTSIT